MDIIPNVLGDKEFLYLDADGYGSVRDILNPIVAKYIKAYVDNPAADPTVVAGIERYLGNDLQGLTLPAVLQEKGITQLITTISPETVLTLVEEVPDLREKLEYLNDNYQNLRVTIKPATRDNYEDFVEAIQRSIRMLVANGMQPTYPNTKERIEANKVIFYRPNSKAMNTGIGIINAKHQQWVMCLKGLRFKEYCDSKDLNYIQRRVF